MRNRAFLVICGQLRGSEQASRLLLPMGGLLVVILAVAGGPLQHWIAAAVALTLVPSAVTILPEGAGEWLRRTAPLGLLSMLAFLTLSDLALGRPPASRDHAIHYFQTTILVEELLPTGRLAGWSERLNNGYPFGDSYPILGYLWAAAPQLATGGLVSLRASYAFGLLAVWVLSLWSVYRVAEIVWREVTGHDAPGTHRLAASLAAGAWLLDAGGSRQGGWEYAMFHGVWPQLLSTGLWVWGLVWTWRAFQGPSVRRWALSALCLAGAILAHPFGLLAVGGASLAWPLFLLTNGSLRDLPPGAIRTWAIIHGLALGLAAGWIVPFLASAEAMGRSPVPWAPLGTLASQVVVGRLFAGDYLGFVAPLGLLGGLVVLGRGRTFGRLALTLVVGMLIAGSEEAITVLHLDLLLSGFKNLQFPRYSIVLKPLWFALAGVGAAALAKGLVGALGPRLQRPLAERIVVALVLGPLLAAILGGTSRLLPRPVGSVDTLEGSSVAGVERALREALRAEQENLGSRPMRVAFLRVGMSGATFPLFSLADVGASVVLDGHIPAVNSKHRVRKRTASVLAALGVTHVIYDRKLRKMDATLAPSLEEVQKLGSFHLARFVSTTEPMASVSLDGATGRLDGATGGVHIEVDETEHRILRLDNVEGRVRLPRLRMTQAPYWRWIATLDGEPLELSEASLFGGALTGTQADLPIDVPAEGTVELTYLRTERERRAGWLSAGLGLLCLLGLTRGADLHLTRRPSWPRKVRRGAWAAAGGVGLVLIVGVANRQHRLLEATWVDVQEDQEIEGNFVRDLVVDDAFTAWWTPSDICEALQDKNARSGCAAADAEPRIGMTYRAPYLFRCVRIVIPPRGHARVFFRPQPGEQVRGFVRRLNQRGSGKNIKWRVGTKDPPARLGNARSSFNVPAGTTDEVAVRFATTSRFPQSVCVAAATFR